MRAARRDRRRGRPRGEGGVGGDLLAGAERASSRRIVQASSSVGTIFSIEATTICTLRQRLGQVAVALIGDDHRGAGLGDQEVGAGDADIGGEEFLAQHGARFGHEVRHRSEGAIRRRGRDGRGRNPRRSLPC